MDILFFVVAFGSSIVGKAMSSAVKVFFGGSPMVGGVQAVALGIITLGTLLYTVNKSRIKTHITSNKLVCVSPLVCCWV